LLGLTCQCLQYQWNENVDDGWEYCATDFFRRL